MEKNSIFVSELSTSLHKFGSYHFCRGNSSKRKTRFGIILKGSGTYIYLNKRLKVSEGDVVFIPENVFCYSEWHGTPEIEVVYVNCFLHYGFGYEPQKIACTDAVKSDLLKVSTLLSGGYLECLEAYSVFYRILQSVLPEMTKSTAPLDKRLQAAVEYITANFNTAFPISAVAKACLISESSLYHLFQSELGQSPVKFLNSIRINVAIEYLESTDYTVYTISGLVGFKSENHFRKVFFDLTGTTPLKFRKHS